jgi:EmrB/QacA subfamily drug resistance transporter
MGTFTGVVTMGSTNVALPTIAEHFRTDLPTTQWVVIGETLAISALLLPMGRLSDIVGRKQVYITGLVIFVLAAAMAGLSSNMPTLIISKIVQGCGSAMTQGTSIAIITSVFPTAERGKALGTHMAVVGSGGLTGPVLGGLLVSHVGWRSVFFLNIPMGILTMVALMIILDKQLLVQDGRRPKFDWPGAGLSTAMLLTFLLAITNGQRIGWSSPPIMVGLFLSVVLLGVFIWWELRCSSPMLDLRLFQHKLLFLAISASSLAHMGNGSVRFLMPFYLQAVLGYSPAQVGLILIPNAIATVIAGPISGLLSDRYGWRVFNVGGMALASAGVFLLSRTNEHSSLGFVMPAMLLYFLGSAIFMSPNTNSIISGVEKKRYGIVSALINLARNSSQVTGIAIATTIVAITMASSGYDSSLNKVSTVNNIGVLGAFTSGLQTVFLVMGGLVILAMILSALKGGRPSESHTPDDTPTSQ